MYAVLRRYTVRLGSVDTAARYAEETLLPQLRQIPGFATYYLVDAGQGTLMSVGLFDTAEGADRANTLISSWFRNDWPMFRAVPPEVTTGRVLAHTALARPAVRTPAGTFEERRSGGDRRAADRRAGGRVVPLAPRILSAG